jgi:hypothetical protein
MPAIIITILRGVRAIAERDGQDPALAEQVDWRRVAAVVSRLDLRRPDPAYRRGGVAAGLLG